MRCCRGSEKATSGAGSACISPVPAHSFPIAQGATKVRSEAAPGVLVTLNFVIVQLGQASLHRGGFFLGRISMMQLHLLLGQSGRKLRRLLSDDFCNLQRALSIEAPLQHLGLLLDQWNDLSLSAHIRPLRKALLHGFSCIYWLLLLFLLERRCQLLFNLLRLWRG